VEQNQRPGYESTQLCPLILDKDTKKYDGEKMVFSTNYAGETGYLPAQN
jgi:hypothetical protein